MGDSSLESQVELTEKKLIKWFNESNTDDDWHGTPALTSEKLAKPQVENSFFSTPAKRALLPNAVTPAKNCRESKPTEPPLSNQAEPLDDPKPSPEPTVDAFPLTLLNDESPEPF